MKTLLKACRRIALLTLLAGPGCGMAAAPCPASAEEAVRLFVQADVAQPLGVLDVLLPKSLAQYRAALEQMLDDDYSPASAAWRAEVLGPDWTPARIHAATDIELLGAYLAKDPMHRRVAAASDIRVVYSSDEFRKFYPWGVTYRLDVDGKATEHSDAFDAGISDGCWKVGLPVRAQMRIQAVADRLRESRQAAPVVAVGARSKLLLLAASRSPVVGAKRLDGWSQPVWIDAGAPLATEANLIGVSAWWACPEGLGAEEPGLGLKLDERAVQALSRLSEKPDFPDLVMVVDGKVVSVSHVQGPLGSSFQLCGQFHSMADARAMAARLRGDSP